ncbi:hypothetical protein [Flexithrix dorotheae]|uniref:hypothetical protein n=1 Tax=Flexithrix dorotheae TaxID=70993 RepID=UPI00035D63FC|nr:hypothetical protein [Flexithrix dorotheae]
MKTETSISILDSLKVFKNHEDYFQTISKLEKPGKWILGQFLTISLFIFVYGFVMGIYHSFFQGLSAGLKLWILFFSSILICFPSFYVIQLILGSQIKLKQVIVIILSGFVMTSSIMLSFSPIAVFFMITGNNYSFLKLLHVGIFIFSGVFGMRIIVEALKYSCEKENIYPKTGVTIFRVWIVVLAFVGIQLAWNLRPFLGDHDRPFEFVRDQDGNFYTAIIHATRDLVIGEKKSRGDHNQIQKRMPNELNTDSSFYDQHLNDSMSPVVIEKGDSSIQKNIQ